MQNDTSKSVVFDGKTYSLDIYGFLDPPGQWDETFAEGMAVQVGIFGGLTDEHWRLIKYLRDKFSNSATIPLVVNACIDNNLRLNRLRRLFPTGYHRGACKVAGLNYEFLSSSNIWLTFENYTTLRTEYKLTETGFLEDFEKWDERFAQLVMHECDEPKPLTETHLKVIGFLRDYYRLRRDIPTVWETCRKNTLGLAELRDLFPGGYRRGVCRAAGLPFFA